MPDYAVGSLVRLRSGGPVMRWAAEARERLSDLRERIYRAQVAAGIPAGRMAPLSEWYIQQEVAEGEYITFGPYPGCLDVDDVAKHLSGTRP